MALCRLTLALVAITYVQANIVELSCSDNALCINDLARNLVKNVREQKAVRLFDVLTIEPVQDAGFTGRSNQGALARFLSTHAISLDLNDKTTLRVTKPSSRNGVLSVDIMEGRSAEEKEEEHSGEKPKGSAEKVEKVEKGGDAKTPKRARRRGSKRVMQVIVPMIMGMKSASAVLLAIAAVAYLTIKAFLASKLALAVTLGMAAKRIYDSFGYGVGLQNHPYLYSQYPLDFSGASSHAYVSGVGAPHFAAPEMYGPTALASHTHQHEMLQQSDASAQQSQPAPSVQIVNATRATERWDGMRRRPMFYGPSRATSDSISEYHDYRH